MSQSHPPPRRPPPLQALRALEAAVRHESYTLAADELALTQSAVSHQLRELEAHLGERLFRRVGRRMLPSARARAMAARVREGLQVLESAIDDTPRRRSAGSLTISVLPSFACKWLVPRLAGFHAEYPDIALHLQASLEVAELRHDGVDLAIRYGRGGWEGVDSLRLAGERQFAVVSPRFFPELPRTPAALRPQHLIGNPFQPWLPWLRAAGLDWPEPSCRLSIGDAALLIDSAISGQGVVLARELLAGDDVAAGRLLRLFDVELHAEQGYWLVWPKTSRKLPLIQALGDWIAAGMARC